MSLDKKVFLLGSTDDLTHWLTATDTKDIDEKRFNLAEKLFGDGYYVPVSTQYGSITIIPKEKYRGEDVPLRLAALPGLIEVHLEVNEVMYSPGSSSATAPLVENDELKLL